MKTLEYKWNYAKSNPPNPSKNEDETLIQFLGVDNQGFLQFVYYYTDKREWILRGPGTCVVDIILWTDCPELPIYF